MIIIFDEKNISKTLYENLQSNKELNLLDAFGGNLDNVFKDLSDIKTHSEWMKSFAITAQQQIPEFKDIPLDEILNLVEASFTKLQQYFDFYFDQK